MTHTVPSSSCLKIIALGISIIGVMVSNIKEVSIELSGNCIKPFDSKSSFTGICA